MTRQNQSILIVGLNYAPEQVGIGPYTAAMAQSLAARGHRVRAVVGKPYYPQWQGYAGFDGGLWREAQEAGVSITRCGHYIPAQPSGLKRILHLASFALSALPAALQSAFAKPQDRPGLVICIAPALLSVPVAWLAAKVAGAKLWIHLQDFEVEAAFATGLVDAGGLPARIARALENRLLGLADRISTISPQMCEKLAAKGIAPDRIVEIRNWADGSFLPDPAHGAAYRAEWGLGERQVALYSGNIANKQGIEILIEAARLLADRKDIAFVICGQGPNRARLEVLAAGLDNVQLHDLQPAERMGELLALPSVHLLPQIPGAADLVLPSKLTNMLASGRPVVATALPGTGLYDEVEGCGISTPPGDAQALAAAIAALAGDPEQRARLGSEAIKRARERWSRETIIDRLDKAIAGLFPSGQHGGQPGAGQ
jgi:colanic acid biosynthesis glycosyl transferase WcaI